jgi:ABC-type nitrate/sulfonate/bicarbonate transport system substrate-binding protein
MASRGSFLAAGAAAVATSNVALAPSRPHLTVGSSAIDAAMGLVSAQRAGFFRNHGVDVDIQIGSGAANAAAVAGGAIQLAASNLVTLFKAHLNGIPFQLVAPSSAYSTDNPTQVLCVRSDAGFKNAADLNGKTVAVTSIGDLLSTSTLAWIDQNGGTASTVKLVEFPPSAQAAALETGRVQAAALAEPFLSTALGTGTVKVFAKIFDAVAPKFLVAAYFGMADYINANRDTVGRFATAMSEGDAFANAHPDQTLPWLIEFAKVDPAVAKRARREVFATAIDPALIQTEIDALVRLKILDRGFDGRDMISPVALNGRR